jgi:Tol biopolymer transport system component
MDPLRSVSDLVWLPAGRGLVVTGSRSAVPVIASDQLWHIDLETGAVRGITNDLSSYSGVSRSADGSRLVTVQHEVTAGIDIGPADGGVEAFTMLVPESSTADGWMGLAWVSADRLVHSTSSEGRVRIRLSSTAGGPALPLTPADLTCLAPRIEAGGESLLASCLKEGHVNIWRFHLDGGRSERLTEGTLDHTPNPMPDGSVVYITFTDQGGSLVHLRPGGGSPERLAGPGVLYALVSPDGSEVFYVSAGDDERYHPRLLSLSGGEPRELDYSAPNAPGPDDDLAWTPDGKGLSWLSEEGQDTVLRIYDVATGAIRELNRFAGRRYAGHAWSPDGKRLALVRETRTGHVVMLTDTASRASGGAGMSD